MPAFQKYPKIPLEDALRVAQAVYTQNKECKVSTAAAYLNSSVKSSTFNTRKAATKWYGLIEEENDTLRCTQLTTTIFAPYNDEEKITSLRNAFLTFEIFKKLYDHLPIGSKLSREQIATMAERECDINVDGKDNFVSIFVDGAIFSGLMVQLEDNQFEKVAAFDIPTVGDSIEVKESVAELTPEVEAFDVPSTVAAKEHLSSEVVHVNKGQALLTININVNIDSSTSPELLSELMEQIAALRG